MQNRDNIETQMGGKYRALDKAATAWLRGDKDIERIAESARVAFADILQKTPLDSRLRDFEPESYSIQ